MRTGTHLILVRHAEAGNNAPGLDTLMSGWTDLPLTARGQLQALELAEHLARDTRARVIYSSPLVRAELTAAALAERLHLEIIFEADLREIHCGLADGLPIGEVRARFPLEWSLNEAQVDPEFRWPHGESYREFRERVLDAMERISLAHRGESVLVVTHAGVISQLMGHLSGSSPALWAQFRPQNASITELRWGEGRGEVICFDAAIAAARRRMRN